MAYDADTPRKLDGYKDEAELLLEARTLWQEASDADRENRVEAVADLEFFAGKQWDEADRKARKGRPCLTINTLPSFIAQVVGDLRINPPAIKVRPAENADKDLADVREGLIRAIENDSGGQAVYANAGQSQTACGIGNFRVVLEYARDDAFDRNIVIKRIENPFAVLWDPFLTEPTGKDAGHAFVIDDMRRSAFEKAYPGKTPEAAGIALGELTSGGWVSKDAVRIVEYWKVKRTPAEIGMTRDGAVVWITKANEAQIVPNLAANSRGEPLRRKTQRTSVCMYLMSGFALLEDPVEYQISRLPLFRVPGWEIHDGTKKTRFGLVRFARDPQKLKNYWRSVKAEKLALAPRQQWLVHETQDGDQEKFREAAENGDTVITWAGAVEPKRLEPPQIEAALMQAAEENAQDMKDVTGLHDASLGIRSNETSGKAILARQREGDVATFLYHDNLTQAISECGRVIDEFIPQVMDTVREARILGADEQQKVIRVNDPGDPDSVDLSKGKFDIYVDTGPSYATKRVEAAESMMAFTQAVPIAGQVAGDLIAKAQDWPLAEEIGERLKRAMPPGITQDPNEPPQPPSPAEQQAQQQQQQAMQMQMAGAQLDLRLKEAQAVKAEHDADTAKAQAGLAYFQLELAQQNGSDMRLKAAQADQAEADAARAHVGVQSDLQALETAPALAAAQTHEMQARAAQAHVGAATDLAHLAVVKPMEHAHSVVDLATKIDTLNNPPDPKEPARD